MTFSRRAVIASTWAAASLAACRPGAQTTTRRAHALDTARLNQDFPALAKRAAPGLFCAGIMSLDSTETWYWNTDRAFPLAGLAAVPIAAAALSEVDAGRLALAEPVRFSATELSPPFSVINQRWPDPPEGYSAQAPASTLMSLALRWGDNTAADVLMKRIGGPGLVTAWLRGLQITEIRIDRYGRETAMDLAALPSFRAAWKDPAAFLAARDQVAAPDRQRAMDGFMADPRDSATVPAMLDFLYKLACRQVLSAASTTAILRWMETAAPGGNLLRAGWDRRVRIAHKGGATPTDLGFTAATNDMAIATLPDGRRYAMAAFLAGSTATEAQRAALFADTARLMSAAAG